LILSNGPYWVVAPPTGRAAPTIDEKQAGKPHTAGPAAGMPSSSNPRAARLLDDDGAAPQSQPQPDGARLQAVQAQVDTVQATMRENVNVMVENMERTSHLEAASASLSAQASQFQSASRATRRQMWWNNCKAKLICWGGAALALTIFILIIAGSNGAFDHHDNDAPGGSQ
jgi:hypothetical protein